METDLDLDKYKLRDRKLRMLGARVTRYRENFLEKAKQQAILDNTCIE